MPLVVLSHAQMIEAYGVIFEFTSLFLSFSSPFSLPPMLGFLPCLTHQKRGSELSCNPSVRETCCIGERAV